MAGYYVLKLHNRDGAYLDDRGNQVTCDADGNNLTNRCRWSDPAIARFAGEREVLVAMMSDVFCGVNSIPMWVDGTGAPPVRATKRIQQWLMVDSK